MLSKTNQKVFSFSKKPPLVVVVVLNWNGKRNTIECLNSLIDLEYPNYEIVVVDNASTDGSQEILKSSFPQITMIQNLKNLGFGEGLNVGIREGMQRGADYVLCMNNDVVVDRHMLEELVQIGELNTNIGGLCPLELSYHKPDRIICAGGEIGIVRGKLYGYGESNVGQYRQVTTTKLLSGPAMMLKTSALRKVGLFDNNYFYGPEDQDIALRLTRKGYLLFFVPQARIWHKRRGATNGKITPLNDYFHVRNFLLFSKKNATNGQLIFAGLYFGFVDFPLTFFKRFFSGKWQNLRAMIKGLIWHIDKSLIPCDQHIVESLCNSDREKRR